MALSVEVCPAWSASRGSLGQESSPPRPGSIGQVQAPFGNCCYHNKPLNVVPGVVRRRGGRRRYVTRLAGPGRAGHVPRSACLRGRYRCRRVQSARTMNAGQGCSNPRMGPVRSLPSTEWVLFYHQDRGLTGPYVGMAPIADQLTKICYTSTNQLHPPHNVYDHSDDGINAHADKLWDAFQAGRNNNPQERILWWDWEENDSSTRHSINVPTSVQYDATRDTFHAAFYEVRIPPGYSTFQVTQEQADRLRAEAARYSAAVAKRL